jgi:lysophospholipase L1-like esterase
MKRLVALVCALVALVLPVPPATAQLAPAPPSSMAAIGDSMTQAADVCCWYGDHPANSWSTGGAGWDGVRSHYERLRSLNPVMAGHNYNDSRSGARMSAGPTQAQSAVNQGAGYVTILLGANDVCTSSPSTMTPVDTFRSQFRQTLTVLDSGLPAESLIFVSSIPDVYQLWALFHGNATAQAVWAVAGICQSLLAPWRTAAGRATVRQRNIDFNTVLAEECARIARCLFDSNAVFHYSFTTGDVSKLDYFHPSLSGQAHLAEVTWAHSWWSGS